MQTRWKTDIGFHVPKLMLLEVWPLSPFIGDTENLKVIDIGCNVGVWAQAFMNTYSSQVGRYYSIDPLDGNIGVFRQRLDNGLVPEAEKVSIHQACIGPTDGTVEINFQNEVSTLASVVLKEMQVGKKTVKNDKKKIVQQHTLDTFCTLNSVESVDLAKIDVEGYEWEVLSGAKNLLKLEKMERIFFEFGQHQGVLGQTFKQFWELLSDHGFHIYRQAVSRNFFGMQHISRYDKSLEQFNSMWMILASKKPHNEKLNSPFVIGKYHAGN